MRYLAVGCVLSSLLLLACGSGGGGEPPSGGPIIPPPPSGTTSMDIGPAGGVLSSEDGKATIGVPAGALASMVTVTLGPATDAPAGTLGPAYQCGPAGLAFDQPVTISLEYDPGALPPGLPVTALRLTTLEHGAFWQELSHSVPDGVSGKVTGSIHHFSVYGIEVGAYQADLEAAQLVPAGTSAAQGLGTFLIDPAGNRVSYSIEIEGLEGAEQSAQIHGPAETGSEGPAVHALLPGALKAGVWTYDESIEADLLAGRTYVEISSSAHPGGELRGQIQPRTDAAEPFILVRLGPWDDGTARIPAIPAAVSEVRFEITAPDLTTIQRTVPATGPRVEADFAVREGGGRRFEATAYDASNTPLYRGVAYLNVADTPTTLDMTMVTVTETSPPTFGGITAGSAVSGHAVALGWNAASDDRSTPQAVTYLVYGAPATGGQDFATPTAVSEPGALYLTLVGLAANSAYYFVVRAMDEAGNVDTNTTERSVSTLAPGSGLYVDVKIGSDGPDCGTAANPCKTITAALARSVGDEPIYVAGGIYEEATGETFPLRMKAGNRFFFEAEYVGVPGPLGNKVGVLSRKVLLRTTGIESVILGAADAVIWNVAIQFASTANSAGWGIHWNEHPIEVHQAWIAGMGDQIAIPGGIAMGGDSLVRGSKIHRFGFSNGRGIIGWDGGNRILDCVIRDNNGGIFGASSMVVRGCVLENNTFGIVDIGGEIVLNVIRDGYVAIQNPEPGTLIAANRIHDNESWGIRTAHLEAGAAPVTVRDNVLHKNSVGVRVSGDADAVIHGNSITCNSWGVATDSSAALDCRFNSWDHSPPTVDDGDPTDGLVGCPEGTDVCYAPIYAGAPLPLLSPAYASTFGCP